MIKALRCKDFGNWFVIGVDALFKREVTINGGHVAKRDEDGKLFLIFDGNDSLSTVCVPMRNLQQLFLLLREELFEIFITDKIITENFYHFVVIPVKGAQKFLVSYSLDTLSLTTISPLPKWVEKEDHLLFDEEGNFLRTC